SELVPAGKLRATTDYAEAIPGADAVVIVVPLFGDDASWEPDFAWMDAATRSLAEHITPGTLVSYETTLPVGTLRTRFVPMIEEISGLRESRDFFAVFSPERVLTGRVFEDLRKYPKLIGAISEAGTARACEFYESALSFDERPDLSRPNGVWDLGSPEASELAKLAETTYRDVNIALANEFALFAQDHGIDVYKVIEASNSQPYSHIHQPGIAVGGHCIPAYPRRYLSTDPSATTARTTRPLHAHGAEGAVHDTFYDDAELAAFGWDADHGGEPADLVIGQTNHPEYRELGTKDVPGVKLIVDGRNITTAENWAGTPRLVLGDGSASTHQQADQA